MADIVLKILNYLSQPDTLFFLRGIKAGNPERAIPSGQDEPILPARIANQNTLHIIHGHCQRYDKLELCIWAIKFCDF